MHQAQQESHQAVEEVTILLVQSVQKVGARKVEKDKMNAI